jgi:hypothetical protein
MQPLAKTAVIGRCSGNVAQGGNVLFGRPGANLIRVRKLRRVNIDHGGVWPTKLVATRECFGVNLLRPSQTVAAGFCQADELFEPCGSCIFEVYACMEPFYCRLNRRVARKLVAAGVDTQLEILRQAILPDRV